MKMIECGDNKNRSLDNALALVESYDSKDNGNDIDGDSFSITISSCIDIQIHICMYL